MKKAILLSFSALCLMQLSAQDDVKKKAKEAKITAKEFKDGWTKGGFINLAGSNLILKNWAAGGSGSTGILFSGSVFAIKKKGIGLWENYLDVNYGVVQNGPWKVDDPGGTLIDPNNPGSGVVQVRNPFVKSDDRLVFQIKYGRRINDKANYAALFNLNTQLFPGYLPEDKFKRKLPVSDVFSQAFGYASVGIDYKPTSYLSVFLSPVTLKYTYVHNKRLAESFGNDSFTNLRLEMGWYLNAQIKKDIMKNISWQSRIEFFNSYNKDYLFKRIDVNWQNTINMKVNKYITVSLITQMLYDDDVDVNAEQEGKQVRTQWKHFTGIGFNYTFGDKL